MNDIKERIYEAQNGFCIIDECFNAMIELHHIVPQTKVNKKNYPLFIHSPMNMVGVCKECHDNYTLHKDLTNRALKRIELIEEWLQELTKG